MVREWGMHATSSWNDLVQKRAVGQLEAARACARLAQHRQKRRPAAQGGRQQVALLHEARQLCTAMLSQDPLNLASLGLQ